MPELIDRQALLEAYDRAHKGPPGGARKLIAEAPTIESEPVRHGRWIFGSSKTSCWMTCSICCKSQSGQTATFSYCPNCGARMDGGADNG